jgi:hypothetical protein
MIFLPACMCTWPPAREVASDVFSDFTTDSSSVVHLLGDLGGFSSAAAVVSALTPDTGHTGITLSLGTSGSIDFLGAQPGNLTASNFSIG